MHSVSDGRTGLYSSLRHRSFAVEISINLSRQRKGIYFDVFLNGMLLDEAVIVLISWYIAHANRTGGLLVHLIHHTYLMS